MRILGVDPGLRRTGFGVIDVDGPRMRYVASGTIVVPTDDELGPRLKVILDSLREIIREYAPQTSAIEKVFVNSNPTSTLLLGQARGAAFCALVDCGLGVQEYTALQIKKSVVGSGRAAKPQVQAMVQRLLNLNGLPAPDSADALACAMCHAHLGPVTARLEKMGALLGAGRSRLRAGRIVDA